MRWALRATWGLLISNAGGRVPRSARRSCPPPTARPRDRAVAAGNTSPAVDRLGSPRPPCSNDSLRTLFRMKLPALASIAVGVVLKARSGLTWSARYAGLLGTRAWAWIVVVLVLVVIGAAAQAGRAFLPDSGGATGAMLACALLLAGVGSVQLRSDLWRRGFRASACVLAVRSRRMARGGPGAPDSGSRRVAAAWVGDGIHPRRTRGNRLRPGGLAALALLRCGGGHVSHRAVQSAQSVGPAPVPKRTRGALSVA